MNFDRDELKRKVIRAAYDKLLSTAQQKTRFMRCPVHREGATVRLSGPMSMSVSACCEDQEATFQSARRSIEKPRTVDELFGTLRRRDTDITTLLASF